jgi:hypothetical protein
MGYHGGNSQSSANIAAKGGRGGGANGGGRGGGRGNREASHVEVPEVDVPEEATAGAISSRARSVSCVARRATMS